MQAGAAGMPTWAGGGPSALGFTIRSPRGLTITTLPGLLKSTTNLADLATGVCVCGVGWGWGVGGGEARGRCCGWSEAGGTSRQRGRTGALGGHWTPARCNLPTCTVLANGGPGFPSTCSQTSGGGGSQTLHSLQSYTTPASHAALLTQVLVVDHAPAVGHQAAIVAGKGMVAGAWRPKRVHR